MTVGADPPVRNSAVCQGLQQQQGVVFPAASPSFFHDVAPHQQLGPWLWRTQAHPAAAHINSRTRGNKRSVSLHSPPPQPPNLWHLCGLRRGRAGHRQRTSYAFPLMDSSVGADACHRATKECHDTHQIRSLTYPHTLNSRPHNLGNRQSGTNMQTTSLVCLLLSWAQPVLLPRRVLSASLFYSHKRVRTHYIGRYYRHGALGAVLFVCRVVQTRDRIYAGQRFYCILCLQFGILVYKNSLGGSHGEPL
ncbi:hypothetical protein MRX96_008959 [Rhipicephalus microplus]